MRAHLEAAGQMSACRVPARVERSLCEGTLFLWGWEAQAEVQRDMASLSPLLPGPSGFPGHLYPSKARPSPVTAEGMWPRKGRLRDLAIGLWCWYLLRQGPSLLGPGASAPGFHRRAPTLSTTSQGSGSGRNGGEEAPSSSHPSSLLLRGACSHNTSLGGLAAP